MSKDVVGVLHGLRKVTEEYIFELSADIRRQYGLINISSARPAMAVFYSEVHFDGASRSSHRSSPSSGRGLEEAVARAEAPPPAYLTASSVRRYHTQATPTFRTIHRGKVSTISEAMNNDIRNTCTKANGEKESDNNDMKSKKVNVISSSSRTKSKDRQIHT